MPAKTKLLPRSSPKHQKHSARMLGVAPVRARVVTQATPKNLIELASEVTLEQMLASKKPLDKAIRVGLPTRALANLQQAMGLNNERFAALLNLKPRTLQRRKEEDSRLNVTQGNEVFRVAQVLSRASEVLGSRDDALNWLQHPNHALGEIAPIEKLNTLAGAVEVMELLGRIEFGVYS